MRHRRRFMREPGFIGIRVGRWWVKVRDTRKSRPLFSELNGYVPTCKVGWLTIAVRSSP